MRALLAVLALHACACGGRTPADPDGRQRGLDAGGAGADAGAEDGVARGPDGLDAVDSGPDAAAGDSADVRPLDAPGAGGTDAGAAPGPDVADGLDSGADAPAGDGADPWPVDVPGADASDVAPADGAAPGAGDALDAAADAGAGDSAAPARDAGADSGAPADAGGDAGPADSAAPGPSGRLLVTELMASNHGTLEDASGGTPDWLELYNPGPDPVDLAGWMVSDAAGVPDRGVLAPFVLPPGGFVVVFASGAVGGADGELHVPFEFSADGEEVLLTEPDGTLADVVTFGPQVADVSWGRPQAVESWPLVGPGSPARASGSAAGEWTAAAFDDGGWGEVVLPVGFDRVEGDPAVNLASYAATTQSTAGFGRTGGEAVDGEWRTFSHTATGDMAPWWRVDLGATATITDLTLLNRVDCCSERLYNVTVEIEDGDGGVVWRSALLNPVGEGEQPASPGDTLDPGLAEAVPGRFVRVRKDAVGGAGGSEWLSLAEVQVGGGRLAPYDPWIATDGAALFAEGRALFRAVADLGGVAADRLVLEVLADDGLALWVDGLLVWEQNLGVGATPVEVEGATPVLLDPGLFDPDGSVVAAEVVDLDGADALFGVTLTAQTIDTALAERAWFAPPTPGEPNGGGWAGFVAGPQVDPPRGFFDAPFAATLSVDTPGASLVYTLDGSLPTPSHGTVVAAAGAGDAVGAAVQLPVETTTVLRARAFAPGMRDSDVATHTWLFLADVVRQPAAPAGLPTTWDGRAQEPVAGRPVLGALHRNRCGISRYCLGFRAPPLLAAASDSAVLATELHFRRPCERARTAHLTIFDVGAEVYDWLTFQPVWRDHCASLADFFPPGTRRVLDLGIGPGISGLALRDRLPGATIVGLDFSRRMLARARQRTAGARIPLVRADAARLPFPAGTFDAVTGHSLLYLLPDAAAAVREIARVLRPGGRAVFLEPHAGASRTALLRLRGPLRFRLAMFLWRVYSATQGRFTPGALEALLATHLSAPQTQPTLGGLGLLATASARQPRARSAELL